MSDILGPIEPVVEKKHKSPGILTKLIAPFKTPTPAFAKQTDEAKPAETEKSSQRPVLAKIMASFRAPKIETPAATEGQKDGAGPAETEKRPQKPGILSKLIALKNEKKAKAPERHIKDEKEEEAKSLVAEEAESPVTDEAPKPEDTLDGRE